MVGGGGGRGGGGEGGEERRAPSTSFRSTEKDLLYAKGRDA